MTDAASYRSLIETRLSEKADAFASIMAQLATYRVGPEATVHFEGEVAAMTDTFPVAICTDGPPDTPHVLQDRNAALGALGPIISMDEEDRFAVWEDGPTCPQHALAQPVIDGVAAEQTIILPWIVQIAKAAGFEAMGCEVIAGLHDHADPLMIVPRPDPTPTTPTKPKGIWAFLVPRKPERKS